MKPLLVLPIIIPMASGALCLVAWRWRRVQRAIAVVGASALFAVSLMLLWTVDHQGVQAVQMGAWPAPFGITLVADLLGAIMVVLGALMGISVVVYSLFSMDRGRESFGYYPLLLILLMGVSGAFLTGDLFNLYVWFEVMLMASFILLALGGERPQLEGGLKYVVLNLISSALFLTAVGILYGVTGTLNMAALSEKLGQIPPYLSTTLAMLFLTCFGIKAGIFPLFFWLPASYHTPPAAVSAIFAGLLTKVGVYALIRAFTLLFVQQIEITHTLILWLAGITMVTGVLGAAAQHEFRRILSFHIVSQIGYMIMGLGLYTSLALAGSVFYLIHHIIVKTNLFLVSGVAHRIRGSFELDDLGGLYKNRPVLALLFMIPAMSLAGIPPLSGFFGKFTLVVAGLEKGSYGIVATALAVSLLTLYSMTKIWGYAFWKPAPAGPDGQPLPDAPESESHAAALMVPIAALAALTVCIGLGAEYFLGLSVRAAAQLMDSSIYVEAVHLTDISAYVHAAGIGAEGH